MDWFFPVDPTADTTDGRPSTPATWLAIANSPQRSMPLWLARRNPVQPGDRIWIYFGLPHQVIAALVVADSGPYRHGSDRAYPWRFDASVSRPGTRGLQRDPVRLDELVIRQQQTVHRIDPTNLPLLLRRSRDRKGKS